MRKIEEYFYVQEQCLKQYGSRSVLLYQKGTFFEIYTFAPSECSQVSDTIDSTGKQWRETIGFACELSEVLDIKLTSCNSNIRHSIENPYMIGVPVIAYEKYKKMLLAKDYTVVKMGQEVNGKNVERKVSEVVNPSLVIDQEALTNITQNMVLVYLEYQSCKNINKFDTFLLTTGVAVIDITTAENCTMEFISKSDDAISALLEIYRFLTVCRPRSVLIYVEDLPDTVSSERYADYLSNTLDLSRFMYQEIRIKEMNKDYANLTYQTKVLHTIFGSDGTVNDHKIIDKLGLELQTYGRIAYISLLQYCSLFDPVLASRIKPPKQDWLDKNTHLILTHNSIQQLNLLPASITTRKTKKIDSLVSVLDKTVTSLGKRLLHKMIQSPMLIATDIERHYDMVHEMLNTTYNEEDLWFYVEKTLKCLPDIDRLHRKLEILTISPKELSTLLYAYMNIIQLYTTVATSNTPTLHSQMLPAKEIESINEFTAKYYALINLDELSKCTVETYDKKTYIDFKQSFLNKGYYSDIDSQFQMLEYYEAKLERIVEHLNMFLSKTRGKTITTQNKIPKPKKGKKDDNDDATGPLATLLAVSEAKAKILMQSRIDVELCGHITTQPYVSGQKIITSSVIMEVSSNIDAIKKWLREVLYQVYISFMHDMSYNYCFFQPLAAFVAKMDLIHSYAKCAKTYNYVRPVISGKTGDPSYFCIKGLRHPIVERIIAVPYVPNDVSLGACCETDKQGMLLYGCNTVGKTTLVKSIALAIIMAQAGMYVAAESMDYRCYSSIISRLTSSDDLFSGKSSFYIEMAELKTALNNANPNTLVVADEISRGSSPDAAAVIAAETILWFLENKATFAISTHIRETLDVEAIRATDKLKVAHLSLTINEDTGELIYGRKLQDGMCDPNYALLVARAIGLPEKFIKESYAIVGELQGRKEISSHKRSRYNNEVVVDSCSMCGATDNLHTHHIREQHDAVNGYVGSVPIHSKGNLAILCQTCHCKLHREGRILQMVESSSGVIVR